MKLETLLLIFGCFLRVVMGVGGMAIYQGAVFYGVFLMVLATAGFVAKDGGDETLNELEEWKCSVLSNSSE